MSGMPTIPTEGNCNTVWGGCGYACIYLQKDCDGEPVGCDHPDVEDHDDFCGVKNCPYFRCSPHVMFRHTQEQLERALTKLVSADNFRRDVVQYLAGGIPFEKLHDQLTVSEQKQLVCLRKTRK